MNSNSELESLIRLLDDNDDIARAAMVKLMTAYSAELPEILSELQETPNPELRKRIHQMQSFQRFRSRRIFINKLICNLQADFPLFDGLKELHLLWFDKDSEAELIEIWQKFCAQFHDYESDTLKSMAAFCREQQLNVVPETMLNAEFYLIGVVLDSKNGTSGMFAAMLKALAENLKLKADFEIIRHNKKFLLLDKTTMRFIDFENNFEIHKFEGKNPEIFSKAMMIKYIATCEFANSVNSDAFRYVQVFGESLAGSSDLSFLPYPYGDSFKA